MINSPNIPRELDARRGDGLDIRLLWTPADDSLVVTVADARTEELFVIPVAPHDAREAFQHPFAYTRAPGARRALRRRLELRTERRSCLPALPLVGRARRQPAARTSTRPSLMRAS